MRKPTICMLGIVLCMSLTACGHTGSIKSDESNDSGTLPGDETSIFRSIEVDGTDVITVDLDVHLAETEAAMLVLEASQDVEASIRYSYSTQDKQGAELFYYTDGSDARTIFKLDAAADGSLGNFWTDKKIVLKKGINTLALAGSDIECKMRLELSCPERDKITYAGFTRQEETMEPVGR